MTELKSPADRAREARNAYQRAYRAAHKDQVRAANERYWNKKYAVLIGSEERSNNNDEHTAQSENA